MRVRYMRKRDRHDGCGSGLQRPCLFLRGGAEFAVLIRCEMVHLDVEFAGL